MKSCQEATRLLSEELDRKLSIYERTSLKLHLMTCRGCTDFKHNLAFLRLACQRRLPDGPRGP